MVLISIYMVVSVYWPLLCCVSVCGYVCVWYQIRILQINMCQTSGTNIPRLNRRRSIILWSKITHQMWHDYTFSYKNKATSSGVGGWGGSGWTKFEKGARNPLSTMLQQLFWDWQASVSLVSTTTPASLHKLI